MTGLNRILFLHIYYEIVLKGASMHEDYYFHG